MQSGWSSRADIGLIGNEDLSIKVSADGSAWTEALAIDAADGRVRAPQGFSYAATGQPVAQYITSIVREIWRIDASRPGAARSYPIVGAGGTTLYLSGAVAKEIFTTGMQDNVAVRVWNVSKSPAESAWVDDSLSPIDVRVMDAGHIAGWMNRDTLQLGDPDPTGDNVLGMVALDISGYLAGTLGAAFPQKGVMLGIYLSSLDGPAAISISADGALASAIGGNAVSDRRPNRIAMPVVCTQP